MAKKLLKGHSHGKLGLHYEGHNKYSRKGQTYKRTKKGFALTTKHAKKKAPWDPLQPLTGDTIDAEVEQGARLKYKGQENALASQGRQSIAQYGQTNDYYNQYLANLKANNAATAGVYQRAQQGVYNQANVAAGQDEAQRQTLNAQAQQSAAIRGTSASVSPEAQQAAQANRATNTSFGGLIGAQGAAQAAYGGALSNAGAAAKVGALSDEQKRLRQVAQLAKDLSSEKGDYKGQLRSNARESERKYAEERQAIGLDVAKANATSENAAATRRQNAADKKAQRKLTKRGQDTTRRGQNLSHQDRVWNQQHPNKKQRTGSPKSGGLTPSQRRANKRSWEKAVDSFRGGKAPKPGSVEPLVRKAAYLYSKGKLDSKTYRRVLKHYGFHAGPHPHRHKKKSKSGGLGVPQKTMDLLGR